MDVMQPARPQGIHPQEGESGSGLRRHARDVDGQNVAQLFKWIKQHLRIKKFLGNSENAVKTQVWCAVATYVLIAIVKKRASTRCLALHMSTDLVGVGLRENRGFMRLAARCLSDRSARHR